MQIDYLLRDFEIRASVRLYPTLLYCNIFAIILLIDSFRLNLFSALFLLNRTTCTYIDRTFYPTSWWAYCTRGAVGSSFKFQKSFCSTCLSRRTLHMDLISCECWVYMGDTHIVYLILKCIWHLSNRIHNIAGGAALFILLFYIIRTLDWIPNFSRKV